MKLLTMKNVVCYNKMPTYGGKMQGRIHSVETFGTVDGPGIRYVIFMQGCNMRCAYCHNPDTWECGGGALQSVDSVIEDVVKYKRYIEGVTVTGGEPLLQVEFLTDLFKKVKEVGLNTCLDTSGSTFDKLDTKKLDAMLKYCDLVLLDLKHIDDEKHTWLTGRTNKNILEFAKYLSDKNVPVWIRYVLVPTINDDENILQKWKTFVDTLKNVEKIELLPYHTMAVEKYKKLGIKYRLDGVSEPTKEQINLAKKTLNII